MSLSYTGNSEVADRIGSTNKENIHADYFLLVYKLCEKVNTSNKAEMFNDFVSSALELHGTFVENSTMKSLQCGLIPSMKGILSFTNIPLLKNVILMFAPELKDQFEEYRKNFTGYLLVTKITTFIKSSVNDLKFAERVSFQSTALAMPALNLSTLSIKTGITVTDHTLQYVKDLCYDVAEVFSIPDYLTVLHTIAEGCIQVTLFVPSSLETQIKNRIHENNDNFKKWSIMEVMLNDECIFFPQEPPGIAQQTMKCKPLTLFMQKNS